RNVLFRSRRAPSDASLVDGVIAFAPLQVLELRRAGAKALVFVEREVEVANLVGVGLLLATAFGAPVAVRGLPGVAPSALVLLVEQVLKVLREDVAGRRRAQH